MVARPIDEPAGASQGRTICIGAPLGDPNMAVAGFAPIKGDNDAGAGAIAGATPNVMGMGPVGMFGLPKSNPRSRRLMTGRNAEGWGYPLDGPTVCCGVKVEGMMGWAGALKAAV